MNKQIEIYTLVGNSFDFYPPQRIVKKVITIDKDVIITNGLNGRVDITIKDAYQNGNNGDWEDDDIVGYKTFNDAKRVMLERVKEKYKKEVQRIKLLEE
jgi:hypothetical protein